MFFLKNVELSYKLGRVQINPFKRIHYYGGQVLFKTIRRKVFFLVKDGGGGVTSTQIVSVYLLVSKVAMIEFMNVGFF